MNGTLYQFKPANGFSATPKVHEVGYQSWTQDNLLVESEHNDILYYTTRWDALCPYINVTLEMLESAPRPFVVYALPPDSPYGVPINDKYGLVNTMDEAFWQEPRRERKFREYDKQYKNFIYTEEVVPGSQLTVEDMFEMGGEHFANYYIDDREVEGFVDYVRLLDVLILRVHSPEGELVLTDVSILLPKYNQLYGSFCQWNRAYKNRSPGIYACLQACRWAAKNGLRYYNLGPVDDYGYKALFVTDHEPIYALALIDPSHPLATDPSSPLITDFKPHELNQIYRHPPEVQQLPQQHGVLAMAG
ncbi:MAG: hypothetical protein ACO24M_06735 [Limnohabitans sp.]|jgi:hypothetical protein